MLFSFLSFISPLLYFSFSFPQKIICFIITNIVKVCDLNFKHSVCSDRFLSWLFRFTFYLLVPHNGKHISTNNYLSFHFPSFSNAGVAVVGFFFFFFATRVKKNDHLHNVTLYVNKAWGKNKNEHFPLFITEWSTLSVYFFLNSTFSYINIAILAFLCYYWHSVYVPFLLSKYLCPNIWGVTLDTIYSYLHFLPRSQSVFSLEMRHKKLFLMCPLIFYWFLSSMFPLLYFLCENWSCNSLMKHALFCMHSKLWKLKSIQLWSHFVHYQWTQGSKCIPTSSSTEAQNAPWTTRYLQCIEGFHTASVSCG